MNGERILAIAGFHSVGDPSPGGWETWFYIPEATFVEQLTYLEENGWQPIGVEAFLTGLVAPETLPERAVLLTFDDGYRSLLDVAVPVLRRFGYPAVAFVPSDFVGGFNSWEEGGEPEEAICGWEELRELARCGMSVQSHGASHRWLSTLDRAEQEQELVRSKAALEAGLGARVDVFAFPYGDGGDERELGLMLRRAGYRAACLYGGGPNAVPLTDPYRLSRLAIGPDTDLEAELAHATR